MSNSRKIIFVSIFAGLLALLIPIFYAENGSFDLQSLRNEKKSLIVKNSKIGLKLFDRIDLFKRLANNDLNLIEHKVSPFNWQHFEIGSGLKAWLKKYKQKTTMFI